MNFFFLCKKNVVPVLHNPTVVPGLRDQLLNCGCNLRKKFFNVAGIAAQYPRSLLDQAFTADIWADDDTTTADNTAPSNNTSDGAPRTMGMFTRNVDAAVDDCLKGMH